MRCPSCGEAMEEGWLETESLVSGVKWRKDITSLSRIGVGGERIYESNLWGIVHVKAERCVKCRIILHKY
ncbi:MAG: PF20097 family protein [Methanomassiliicoccales archaeon]|nr:PF20097 family protein [Methanomassiliicoccales archaeon]